MEVFNWVFGPKLHKFEYEFDSPPSCIFLLNLGSLSPTSKYTPTLVEIIRNISYHYFGYFILSDILYFQFYVGIDGENLVFNSRQQPVHCFVPEFQLFIHKLNTSQIIQIIHLRSMRCNESQNLKNYLFKEREPNLTIFF